MKPITLKMSAFGSYAGVTEIDFTKINKGIFLITGDTGSGKSTIFDAIVYALYDRTSAGVREPSDMRSQYAAADMPTYVEYTFAYEDRSTGRSDIYKITRNPKYTRISKRKDKDGNLKETVEQPSVELIMPDGKAFCGKVRETNEKIVDIIGLDAEQFTQVAVLAQGEFMKLLQAPSSKRREIFARIFDTRIYSSLQERLRQESKRLYVELEDNQKQCESELSAITPAKYEFTETQSEALLENIKEMLRQAKENEKKLNTRLLVLQSQIDENVAVRVKQEGINTILVNLDKELNKRQHLESQTKHIDTVRQRLELAEKAQRLLETEKSCQRCQDSHDACSNRLELLHRQLEALHKEEDRQEKLREELLKRQEKEEPVLLGNIAAIEKELGVYDELEIQKMQVVQCEGTLAAKNKEQEKYIKLLETKQQDLVELHARTVKLRECYHSLNDSFIACQAGLLAAELVPGQPCPVCGSLSHPHKAQSGDVQVSQAAVNKARQDWQDCEDSEQEHATEISGLRDKLNYINNDIGQCRAEYQAAKSKLEVMKTQVMYADKVQAQSQKTAYEKQLMELRQHEAQSRAKYDEMKEQINKLAGQIKSESKNQEELASEVEKSKIQLQTELTEQGFFTYEAYRQAVLTLDETDRLKAQTETYKVELIRNKEAVRQLELQLSQSDISVSVDMQRYDLSVIDDQLAQLREEKASIESERQSAYVTAHRNEDAYHKLKKLFQKRETLKQEYELYSNLDKTANGTLSGSAKLDFQTYIQRRYFEMIVHEANKRLVKMSSNQFVLQCRSIDRLKGQGAVGLDLDVYSLVNDRTRDVKTLSGGESFMAALSMALGMADVMQNTAGKIKIDTMYVDEGFGSLDEESLTDAVKILRALAGHDNLVGIISHVASLKEQIEHKLCVKKDENGSHIEYKC